jgi:hypothetical protein
VTFDGTGTLTSVNGGAAANVTIATPGWSNGAAAGSLEWQILDSNWQLAPHQLCHRLGDVVGDA